MAKASAVTRASRQLERLVRRHPDPHRGLTAGAAQPRCLRASHWPAPPTTRIPHLHREPQLQLSLETSTMTSAWSRSRKTRGGGRPSTDGSSRPFSGALSPASTEAPPRTSRRRRFQGRPDRSAPDGELAEPRQAGSQQRLHHTTRAAQPRSRPTSMNFQPTDGRLSAYLALRLTGFVTSQTA